MTCMNSYLYYKLLRVCWDMFDYACSFCKQKSDSQCRSRNCPGLDPSILRQGEILGAADEAVLNKVQKKLNKSVE